jgi:Lipocalin-like domain
LKKSPKDTLIGTWMQVSLDTVSADGTRRPLYGENAKGMIIYTSDGYFTLMQASVDLPKLKSGMPSKATPEEAKAVIANSIAYFGKYSLDETSMVLSLDIHASTTMTKEHRNSVDPEVTAKTGSGTPAQFRANVVPRLHVMVHRAGPRSRIAASMTAVRVRGVVFLRCWTSTSACSFGVMLTSYLTDPTSSLSGPYFPRKSLKRCVRTR